MFLSLPLLNSCSSGGMFSDKILRKKIINHIVLIKFNVMQVKQNPVKFVLPGKLSDFWNFIFFLATKTLTDFMEQCPSG